jgi:trimeric autotransporter adhesin
MKPNAYCLVLFALLTYFAPTLGVRAVVPPPDGGYPGNNTAEGTNALFNLTTGSSNTAVGWFSLKTNATGSFNTAVGAGTLNLNTGNRNTAVGAAALFLNNGGVENTGNGTLALFHNVSGEGNTAIGDSALFSNTTGGNNTALGGSALRNTTGDRNTALGILAGSNATTGSDNVYIGADVLGVAGETQACYISSIVGQTSASGIPVFVNFANKLGTATSSKRFKDDIKPMDKASEALFSLKPVSFRYKKEIDPGSRSQFGLVAEDVERVHPDLVMRDKEGKPYTVRYDQVNAMLLNEFLKEHRHVQEQDAIIARQQKQIEALTAGLQKVSAQLELSKQSRPGLASQN